MKNKFISLVIFIYISIISYILLTNKLGYFLAPQMHKYVYIALPILILMFIVITNNQIHYHYKFSDIFLLMPLIAIIISGDCKLSLSYSANSLGNFSNKKEDDTIVVEILPEESDDEEKKDDSKIEESSIEEPSIVEPSIEEPSKEEPSKEETKPEENPPNYDFTKPDFDIVDETFVNVTEYLSFEKKSKAYVGKTIRLRGFTVSDVPNVPEGYKIFGKYQISCCVADSFISGMLIKYDGTLEENAWYEIEGVLEKINDSKYYYTGIKVINIKKIKEEEIYVYPCYAYGDGSCKEVSAYNLK